MTSAATGLVIDGKFVPVPGVRVENWHDNPAHRLRMPNDGRSRLGTRINAVVIHSTHGVPGGSDQRPQRVLPGARPSGDGAEANIRYWTRSDANAGAHIILDFDGQVICTADLAREETYHATSVNDVTVGIELVQGLSSIPVPDAPHGYAFFYEKQLAVLVAVVDVITASLRIQRQIQSPYHGSAKPVERLVHGGKDCVGVYMHRDQTSNRGPGDAGDCVLEAFLRAGYEPVDFAAGADLEVWRKRQLALVAAGAVLTVDGVPGPITSRALEAFGHARGMWVQRP
jgi:hypothetical protein